MKYNIKFKKISKIFLFFMILFIFFIDIKTAYSTELCDCNEDSDCNLDYSTEYSVCKPTSQCNVAGGVLKSTGNGAVGICIDCRNYLRCGYENNLDSKCNFLDEDSKDPYFVSSECANKYSFDTPWVQDWVGKNCVNVEDLDVNNRIGMFCFDSKNDPGICSCEKMQNGRCKEFNCITCAQTYPSCDLDWSKYPECTRKLDNFCEAWIDTDGASGAET